MNADKIEAKSHLTRYFYHSFPRPRGTQDDLNAKGLKILSSICRNGLLLVPESVSWADPSGSRTGDRIRTVQRRISFTELAPNELSDHAKRFGPFALEYTIGNFRRLGALPVIYVPDANEGAGLECAGTSILARLTDALQIISALAEADRLTADSIEADTKTRDGEVYTRKFDAKETAAIRDYLSFLRSGPKQSFAEIANALLASASLFYPTENLQYTGELGYYRQREWRIFSGPFVHGQPTTKAASEWQSKELLDIDREVFSRNLTFADGNFSLAEKSHFLYTVSDKHVLTFARRIIAPSDAVDEAARTLKEHNLTTSVVALG